MKALVIVATTGNETIYLPIAENKEALKREAKTVKEFVSVIKSKLSADSVKLQTVELDFDVTDTIECAYTGLIGFTSQMSTAHIYANPTIKTPNEHYLISESERADFESEKVFYCNHCNKNIREDNGYTKFLRIDLVRMECVCVECQEKMILESGIRFDTCDKLTTEEIVRSSHISVNDETLIEKGYIKVKSFDISYNIDPTNTMKDLYKEVDNYKDENKVIVNIESLSQWNDGSFSLWVKSNFEYNIDEVLNGVIECFEFCEDTTLNDEQQSEFKAKIKADVQTYIDTNRHLLGDYDRGDSGLGNDIYYTSLGHGVGFWDRGLNFGEQLTTNIKASPLAQLLVNLTDEYRPEFE